MEASALPRGVLAAPRALPAARLRLRTDEQLAELFRDGNEQAFRAIHDRYRTRLHAYARQMLAGRSAQDVEDAVQDVFERAHTALRYGGEVPTAVRVWLYRVARNRCIDELRRRPPQRADIFAVTRQPPSDTVTVAERSADVARLLADLRELPEQQRSALLMRELQGLSHEELASVLEVSVGAVKSLLVRARGGLVEAIAAREVACTTVRGDLARAHDRGVKPSGQARRHMRECEGCCEYRCELRAGSRALAGLLPAPALGPLALLGRVLRRGAHAGGGTQAGGVSAAKVAAVICAAAAVGASGGLERLQSAARTLFGTAQTAAPALHAARRQIVPAAHPRVRPAIDHRRHHSPRAPRVATTNVTAPVPAPPLTQPSGGAAARSAPARGATTSAPSSPALADAVGKTLPPVGASAQTLPAALTGAVRSAPGPAAGAAAGLVAGVTNGAPVNAPALPAPALP